jgi:branched-chain amino acid aminotransferase
MYAILNNTLIDEKEAVVPVTNREVFFNFSVYESLKVLESKTLFLNDHIERFLSSAEILGMEHSFSAAEIEESVQKLISANKAKDATVRMQMIGGTSPLFFIFLAPLPRYKEEWYREGVKAVSYRGERIFPKAKSNCLLLNYVASREAEKAGAMEALLVDRDGKATEGTRSNLFAFDGPTLVTADEDILFGVTRKLILEAAEHLDIRLRYEKIPLRKLLSGTYSQPFISSTSMGAMPLHSIDGIVTGKSFPKVSLIHQELREREIAEYKK